MDLELDALFELSQPVARMPKTRELTRLDNFFEDQDYAVETADLDKDDDGSLREIKIEGNQVIREYHTVAKDGSEITTFVKSARRGR
jgi:hypothetical protein